METLPTTAALLDRLLHHPLPEIELSLTRIGTFLEKLGNPHLRLPPVVHVAGTNGKGSLIAYLRAMLEAGGFSCHVYTSPHLVRFHERIVIAGREIDDTALRELLSRVVQASADFPMTFFESTTAAAFLAFAQTPADIVLLETGMGGRLDATNLVPRPRLTAITPIGFDHTEFLGGTLSEIAYEKAGIMKAGVPCVIGSQEAEALQALQRHAQSLAVPLSIYGRDFTQEKGEYRSPALVLNGLAPSLAGDFQYHNAATALACAQQLLEDFPLTPAQMLQGIAGAHWPARLQKLEGGVLTALLGADTPLWLDGGHNPAAGEAIARWLEERRAPVHLVVGMLRDKDAEGYLAPLAPHLASLTAVPIPGESKATPPQALCDLAASLGISAVSAGSVEEALAGLRQRAAGGEVLIGGSLYLAGSVLAKNQHHPMGTMV